MLSGAEKQILTILHLHAGKDQFITQDDLDAWGKKYFCSFKMDWKNALKQLENKRLLSRNKNHLMLHESLEGVPIPRIKPRFRYWYNDWYRMAHASPTHSALCEYAYGINLCQTGMMTHQQIDYLCQIIRSSNYTTGIDLGCGIGAVTQYLHDHTELSLVGIDMVASGIKLARLRAKHLRTLNYTFADIRRFMADATHHYDCILSLDTLYFLGDHLKHVLLDSVDKLTPDGTMFVFYSAWEAKDRQITSDGNRLGRYLHEENISAHRRFLWKNNLPSI